MSDPVELLPPPARRRRRRWLLLLLVPLTAVAAAWLYLYFASDLRLKRVLAETDRLDPHWRFDDIQAARALIPDEENGALTVIAVKAKGPGRWPEWEIGPGNRADDAASDLDAVLRHLKPNEELTPADRSAMREEMERAAPALQLARRLADQPRGRFPIVYSRNYVSTMLPNIQDARDTARMLQYDAMFRAQSGDLDGSAVSCRALVNNARSIGDEPNLIAMLVRMAIRAIAAGQAERTVGLGEPPPDLLAALQKAMEEEADVPLFLIGLRGERAGDDLFMQSLQDGTTSVAQFKGLTAGPAARSGSWLDPNDLLYLPGTVTASRAALLDRMNKLIEISKLPVEEQAAPLAELRAEMRKEPFLIRELMPATEKVHMADHRTQALLRCAAAGLAAERYRRRHGRWPDGLADLTGEFLSAVPRDPFDNKPLRYRKDEEGVIIYSVGQDGKDDGGDRATLNTYKPGTDVGFRLWDVDKRRRPRQ